jgi:CcmD family protein
MTALAIAFGCVWIVVALYVGWLRRNQQLLANRVQELAEQVAQARKQDSTTRKAA